MVYFFILKVTTYKIWLDFAQMLQLQNNDKE